MKQLLFAISLLWHFSTKAQVVRIPDPNFKQRVIALGHDKNDDGQIEVLEAQAVTKLDVSGLGIVNMEGINSFTNIDELDCVSSPFFTADCS